MGSESLFLKFGTLFDFVGYKQLNKTIMNGLIWLTFALNGLLQINDAMQTGNTDSKNSIYRKVENSAFQTGEKITYVLHYGILNAGEATLEVKKTDKKINGRKVLHVVGTGRSISAFDLFYKVRDTYESYIDEESIIPWTFVRRVNEGGYKINQDYSFDHPKKKVDNGTGKKFDVPTNVQDMISAFYYARTMDFSKAKTGDIFTINLFYDDTNFPLKIKYMGKETVSIRMGKYKCMKFIPVVEKGRVFKSEEDLTVWISDDKNQIPILAKAKIMVGSIKMEVQEYSGLASPISKVKK
jgi:hypothetical protein